MPRWPGAEGRTRGVGGPGWPADREAAGHGAGDVVTAASSMVCLHGTDPATVYLPAWARVDGMIGARSGAGPVRRPVTGQTPGDAPHALFVFPRSRLGLRSGGDQQPRRRRRAATARPRRRGRRAHRDGEGWLTTAGEQVLTLLSDGREATSSELRDAIPCRPVRFATAKGGPGAGRHLWGPRSDDTVRMLVRAGLVPRPVQGSGVRHQRQRRTHRVV